MEQQTGSKLGKEYDKAVYCHPVYLSYMQNEKYSCSVVSDSTTLWTVARQAPPSTGFSRQEYWNGLPFPYPNMQNSSCKMPGWIDHKLESRLQGKISTASDTQMIPL